MYAYGSLVYGRDQHRVVKELSSNLKKRERIHQNKKTMHHSWRVAPAHYN